MPSVHDALFWANRRAVAREITRRGYRVSGETLNRWVRDKAEVPAVVEHIVFDLFGIETQQSPPAWAEGLADKTAMKVIAALVDPDVLAALPDAIAALEALPLPRDGSPPANGAPQDQGAPERQGQ